MKQEISTQILNAAEVRFRSYGFGKTTMAEIASDIDMSTANLYRFYENKLAIGSAMALRSFDERKAFLKEIVERQGISESQRLEIFVLEILNYMHRQFSYEPKISELVDVIVKKRPDLVQLQKDSDKKHIEIILRQGMERNEFEVANAAETAGYVQAAIAKFSSPFFIGVYPLEELQQLAKGVVSLMLNGLVKR